MREHRRDGSVRAAVVAVVFLASFLVQPGHPAAAATTPDPFYGTWYDIMSATPEASRVELDHQAAVGIGLVRQYIWWDRIETSPGVFNWTRTDQMLTDLSARGMRVLPTLLYPPAFYSSKPAGSTSTALFPPSDPETMGRFAEAMARRYGPGGTFWGCSVPSVPSTCRTPYLPITAWEVWNEPDFPSWWKGSPNAAEYLPLLQATSAGLRRADPNAEVVLGSLTNDAGTEGNYLEQLYQLGAAPWFDTVALNPYGTSVAETVRWLREARARTQEYDDGRTPLRVTEYGWATGGRSTLTVTDEPCQAALLYEATRRLGQLRTELDIRSITQFQWHDVPVPDTNTAWPHRAGLLRADGSAKPSLGAVTEAIADRPAPAGLTPAEVCPSERQPLDPRPADAVATDTFTRSVAGAWGTADKGGDWTLSRSTGGFSVSGGAGRVAVPAGATREAVLGATSSRDVDVEVSVATDKPVSGDFGQVFTLFTRRQSDGAAYGARIRRSSDGSVRLGIVRTATSDVLLGTEVVLPGAAPGVGQSLVVRLRAAGASPTTVSARAWVVGDAEPADWQVTATDETPALQGTGAVGVRASLSTLSVSASPTTFVVDDLHATSTK
jgi:hypothetical protein